MSKPVVVYTRPRDWHLGGYRSEKLDLNFVPISGLNPKKRNGRPCGDGIGDVVTKEGLRILMQMIEEKKPDIFFHAIHAKIESNVLCQIRKISPKTLIVVAEGNYPDSISPYVQKNRKYVDAILLNSYDLRTKKKYRDVRFQDKMIGTLYDGFEIKDHPAPKVKPMFDCFFGGSNIKNAKGIHKYPNGLFRQQFMHAIHNNYRLDLHGYPTEWGKMARERLNFPMYYLAFHNSAIAVNVNHLELERYYTRRTIHAGASGRLYLVKYIPNMEKDFEENGKYMVWFHSIDEGIERISYYLENEKEREEIAARCRSLFLKKHTWQARLNEFENFVFSIL